MQYKVGDVHLFTTLHNCKQLYKSICKMVSGSDRVTDINSGRKLYIFVHNFTKLFTTGLHNCTQLYTTIHNWLQLYTAVNN